MSVRCLAPNCVCPPHADNLRHSCALRDSHERKREQEAVIGVVMSDPELTAVERLRNGGQPDLADQVEAEIRAAYAEGRNDAKEDTAAPDLLEAVQRLLACNIEENRNVPGSAGAIRCARAAIAKADAPKMPDDYWLHVRGCDCKYCAWERANGGDPLSQAASEFRREGKK